MNFRELTAKEEKEFREWARENYEPFTDISGVWHPVVQDECSKINKEQSFGICEPVEDCQKCGFCNPS